MQFPGDIPVLSTEQMVEVDRMMIEEYQITLIQMMENAGRNLAELARRMLGGQVSDRSIAILSGAGNNGGGGLVAARHLHNWGAEISLVLAFEPAKLKEVPAHQWHILQKMGIKLDEEPALQKADLINKLADDMELSKKDAQIVVDTVFEATSKALVDGDKVELRGFGSFKTKERKARQGRNPKTGAKVKVPAKRVPFFKAGKDLKIVG